MTIKQNSKISGTATRPLPDAFAGDAAREDPVELPPLPPRADRPAFREVGVADSYESQGCANSTGSGVYSLRRASRRRKRAQSEELYNIMGLPVQLVDKEP